MAIFHSYVKLPEGIGQSWVPQRSTKSRAPRVPRGSHGSHSEWIGESYEYCWWPPFSILLRNILQESGKNLSSLLIYPSTILNQTKDAN